MEYRYGNVEILFWEQMQKKSETVTISGKKCRALKLEGKTKFCPKNGCHSATDPQI